MDKIKGRHEKRITQQKKEICKKKMKKRKEMAVNGWRVVSPAPADL